MKRGNPASITKAQKAALDALAALPDETIDLSDAPEMSDFSDPRIGLFARKTRRTRSGKKRREAS